MSQYIIYGAGAYGRAALAYYAEINVSCFADGSSKKVGRSYLGKPVISFDEMIRKSKSEGLIIVLALQDYYVIKERIEQNGIDNIYVFEPSRIDHMTDLLDDINGKEYENSVLIGPDHIANELKLNLKVVADVSEAILIDADCYIVADEVFHATICERLRQAKLTDVYDLYRQRRFYSANQLIFKGYNAGIEEVSEEDYVKTRGDFKPSPSISQYVSEAKKGKPLFGYMEIETINKCNGLCSFCPVNVKEDTRIHAQMTIELFEKIILELKEMNYSGFLSLYSNNEPFLDERIIDFAIYARKMLPKAYLHLWTNGTLLTLDKFKIIIDVLDELIIDNYNDEMKLIKPVQIIADYIEDNQNLIKKVAIVLRRQNQVLSTRGGNAPNRKIMPDMGDLTCVYPFRQMIIRPTGEVSLCCNDPLGKYTLGDVSKQSIKDVWYGEKYCEIRNLIAKGRKKLEACKNCDVIVQP